MPLSGDEQRTLDGIERFLRDGDPEFAATVSFDGLRRRMRMPSSPSSQANSRDTSKIYRDTALSRGVSRPRPTSSTGAVEAGPRSNHATVTRRPSDRARQWAPGLPPRRGSLKGYAAAGSPASACAERA